MARNNVKVLTNDERTHLLDKYEFIHRDDYILVKVKNYGRITAQPIDKPFSLNTDVRKITITVEAITLWIDYFKDDHSLLDVQNAINILTVAYQQPTKEDIAEQLARVTAKIKRV